MQLKAEPCQGYISPIERALVNSAQMDAAANNVKQGNSIRISNKTFNIDRITLAHYIKKGTDGYANVDKSRVPN